MNRLSYFCGNNWAVVNGIGNGAEDLKISDDSAGRSWVNVCFYAVTSYGELDNTVDNCT